MKIKVNEITIDPAVAIREGTDEDTIQRYEDNFERLPPVVVYKTDTKYLLADGFHRLAAAERKGLREIDAEIREGTDSEAKEYAIYANLRHGKPLTREEYKKAIFRLRNLHPKPKDPKRPLPNEWGVEKIAQAVGRDVAFVRTVLTAEEVRGYVHVHTPVEDRKLVEISRVPKTYWQSFVNRAPDFTVETIKEKARQIKNEPSRADEILAPPPKPEKTDQDRIYEAGDTARRLLMQLNDIQEFSGTAMAFMVGTLSDLRDKIDEILEMA